MLTFAFELPDDFVSLGSATSWTLLQQRVTRSPTTIYRLLLDTDTNALASKLRALLREEVCGEVTAEALVHLGHLFRFRAKLDRFGNGRTCQRRYRRA